jgi:uncharacterized damage-inducible protein DinB
MPIDLPTLRELFDYQRWATAKILDCVAPLTDEELRRPIGGSFGSLSGTLVHAYGADWVWLERLHGRSPRSLPRDEDLSTLEAIRSRWAAVEKERDAYLAALSPERLGEWISYVNFAGESCRYRLDEVLFHVANHLTYHRGQIANQLRQLGKPAVATDYLRLLDAQRSAS